MFNPQMMGAMGQIPNVPPIKELWKNEKSKYRHWIILLGIGLLAIFSMILIAFILNLMNAGTMHITINKATNSTVVTGNGVKLVLAESAAKRLTQDAIKTITANEFYAIVNRTFMIQYIVYPVVQLTMLFVGTVLYVQSLFTSYKVKNFARLSQWPTMIIGIATIFSVLQLFGWGGASFFDQVKFPGGIFSITANILFIVIYFAASAPVSRLRRTFMLSERVQKMKEMQQSPEFQKMQQQFQQNTGMNAFGPMGGTVQPQQNQPQTPNQPNTVTPATPEIKPERKKLEEMSKEELIEVAKELSISGYSTMNKKELIDSILRVTNNN